jgi:hypothetical protein
MNKNNEKETFEQLAARFPELDDAGRRRAAVRIAAGADAAVAVNDETIWQQLTKIYN